MSSKNDVADWVTALREVFPASFPDTPATTHRNRRASGVNSPTPNKIKIVSPSPVHGQLTLPLETLRPTRNGVSLSVDRRLMLGLLKVHMGGRQIHLHRRFRFRL